MKIYGFYHIACMSNWREIVEGQVRKMDRYGLSKATSRMHGTILGFDGGDNYNNCLGWDVFQRDPDILKFEFPTLSMLWHAAQREEFYAYYVHSKGVRTGCLNGNIAAWRWLMEHFVIERWQDAVKKLDEGYDCVGCEPGRMPWAPPQDYFHYAGNFFWARSDFIRRLPPVESLNLEHREQAEAWIGMAGTPNYYVAYRSGVDHNQTFLPMSAYLGKGYE